MGGMEPTHDRLIEHVTRGTTSSPYVSLSRSFGVARDYALVGAAVANQSNPAYVYEIELTEPLPRGLLLLDPVLEVARNAPAPTTSPHYQHDGSMDFLMGIIDPQTYQHFLRDPAPQPPGSTGTLRAPALSRELEAIVRALRDAEILAVGTIPMSCISRKIPVF